MKLQRGLGDPLGRTHTPSFSFSSSPEFSVFTSPGPGFYNIPITTFDGRRSHLIQNRIPIANASDAANVSFYDINKNHIEARLSSTIGSRKALTSFFEEIGKRPTPGPSMPQPKTLPRNPIKIGKKLAPIQDNSIPGPATYLPKTNAFNKPQLVIPMNNSNMARESFFTCKSDVPGPGAYDPFPPTAKPRRWATKLRNVKPIPVNQLKRTVKKMKDDEKQSKISGNNKEINYFDDDNSLYSYENQEELQQRQEDGNYDELQSGRTEIEKQTMNVS